MTKQTKSTSEIGAALVSGGLKHSSKDFGTTIRSVLGPRKEFTRVNSEWGLTEWYPGRGRGRKPKIESERQIKKKAPKAPVKNKVYSFSPQSLAGLALAYLTANPTRKFSAQEVAQQTGGDAASTAAALSALYNNGYIARPERGAYQAKKG